MDDQWQSLPSYVFAENIVNESQNVDIFLGIIVQFEKWKRHIRFSGFSFICFNKEKII